MSKEVVGKCLSWPCKPLLSELKAPSRFSLDFCSLLGVCAGFLLPRSCSPGSWLPMDLGVQPTSQ